MESTHSPADVPAHVPGDLIRDFDYVDIQGEKDVYVRFKRLHQGPDIFFTPRYGGHWVVTRYADMDHILSDDEHFSNRHSTIPRQPIRIPLAESDGQIHRDFRKLLQPFFVGKSIELLETKIRKLTVSLIEGFHGRGQCDFAEEFALKMPIYITMDLLGLPLQDAPHMIKVAEGILHSVDHDVQMETYGKIFQYLAEKIIPERRTHPGSDMISTIVRGTVEGGRPLAEDEILGLCCALIAGGLDTVPNMLSFMILFLARNPGHRQQLIDDPALINDAVEELIRRHHIGNFTRVVIKDMDYKGMPFKAGDIVMTPTTLAGLDEQRYADAMSVDFRRQDKKHLAFGRGPHQCIGIMLARSELRIFLAEWLKRIPQFEITSGDEAVVAAAKVNHVLHLPISWKVAQPNAA